MLESTTGLIDADELVARRALRHVRDTLRPRSRTCSSSRWKGAPRTSGPASAVCANPSNEEDGRFSPDGEWVADVSNESAPTDLRSQVQPGADQRIGKCRTSVMVAQGGGSLLTAARRDGKEPAISRPVGTMMSFAIALGPELRAQAPGALFQGPADVAFGDVTADGQRFLLVERGSTITVVLNWIDGLNVSAQDRPLRHLHPHAHGRRLRTMRSPRRRIAARVIAAPNNGSATMSRPRAGSSPASRPRRGTGWQCGSDRSRSPLAHREQQRRDAGTTTCPAAQPHVAQDLKIIAKSSVATSSDTAALMAATMTPGTGIPALGEAQDRADRHRHDEEGGQQEPDDQHHSERGQTRGHEDDQAAARRSGRDPPEVDQRRLHLRKHGRRGEEERRRRPSPSAAPPPRRSASAARRSAASARPRPRPGR